MFVRFIYRHSLSDELVWYDRAPTVKELDEEADARWNESDIPCWWDIDSKLSNDERKRLIVTYAQRFKEANRVLVYLATGHTLEDQSVPE